eukprot:gene11439-11585_t
MFEFLRSQPQTIAFEMFAGAKNGRRSVPKSQIVCKVDDCHQVLSSSKAYYQRHRVCAAHLAAMSAVVDAVECRFCQQCGKFQPLEEFDADKSPPNRRPQMRRSSANRALEALRSLNASSTSTASDYEDDYDDLDERGRSPPATAARQKKKLPGTKFMMQFKQGATAKASSDVLNHHAGLTTGGYHSPVLHSGIGLASSSRSQSAGLSRFALVNQLSKPAGQQQWGTQHEPEQQQQEGQPADLQRQAGVFGGSAGAAAAAAACFEDAALTSGSLTSNGVMVQHSAPAMIRHHSLQVHRSSAGPPDRAHGSWEGSCPAAVGAGGFEVEQYNSRVVHLGPHSNSTGSGGGTGLGLTTVPGPVFVVTGPSVSDMTSGLSGSMPGAHSGSAGGGRWSHHGTNTTSGVTQGASMSFSGAVDSPCGGSMLHGDLAGEAVGCWVSQSCKALSNCTSNNSSPAAMAAFKSGLSKLELISSEIFTGMSGDEDFGELLDLLLEGQSH